MSFIEGLQENFTSLKGCFRGFRQENVGVLEKVDNFVGCMNTNEIAMKYIPYGFVLFSGASCIYLLSQSQKGKFTNVTLFATTVLGIGFCYLTNPSPFNALAVIGTLGLAISLLENYQLKGKCTELTNQVCTLNTECENQKGIFNDKENEYQQFLSVFFDANPSASNIGTMLEYLPPYYANLEKAHEACIEQEKQEKQKK